MIDKATICAISTPVGVGGIAVVRISGKDAKSLAERYLFNDTGKRVTLSDHRAKRTCFNDDGFFVDDVVATYFVAPHSYTGEDVVEISCHGSLYVQQRLLQCLLNAGARLAEPGEFTLRAFLNHKMNLSQAEAVADLIDSRSESAHRLAVSQLRGGYAKQLETLRQQVIDMAALLELELDFSDEDVEFANRERLGILVDELKEKIGSLVESFRMGNALKRGIPVVIIGRPNVGKSSLLNALLMDDRAIVSPVAGTTRDTIEETMTVGGILFRFIDTAGLREGVDFIESIGIERAYKAVGDAQVVLYVHDVQNPNSFIDEDLAILENRFQMEEKTVIVVMNKSDLAHAEDGIGVRVSAKEGSGVDELKNIIAEKIRSKVDVMDKTLLTNARHLEAMKKVLSALEEVRKGLEVNLTADLLVIDIRDALYHLGTITGVVTNDEVLSSIFSRFCVGK